MKYYELLVDMEREKDIACYSKTEGIEPQIFMLGKKYNGWDNSFYFYFDENEGNIATDYLVNDKHWFVVSAKLRKILETMNTEIQFLPVRIIEKRSERELADYYIANILRVVDALCLEKSEYFETNIPKMGKIYSVLKYGIFSEKTEKSDVFKLANRQEIPIFVSENFKNRIIEEGITGIALLEIRVFENE